MKERWMLYGKRADFQGIAKKYGIDMVTARIIRNRNVTEEEGIDKYLNGGLESLSDPALLKDGVKAAEILKAAIEQNKKLAISSDFDDDGIFSGILLKEALKELGARAEIYTPNRITEGYGINKRIVEEAYENGAELILTCDNGIAAFEAIETAKKLGMKVIVTDHHEVPFKIENGEKTYILPQADAIVDIKQADCRYPYKELCGTGTAFMLMKLLYRICGKIMKNIDTYLQYTAIATVADVVDLTGENRILVKEGLNRLHRTKHTGLKALMQACAIEPENVKAYHIGFIIGPCFNASGRLDTIEHALALIEEKDEAKARGYAQKLKAMNDERKELTELGLYSAVDIIEKSAWKDEPVFLVYVPGCHESVAGIIAGRIREKYYRPTLVFTDTIEKDIIKASGRSIEAYDMFTELSACRDLFIKFGGHRMAAGLSMHKDNLDLLRTRLVQNCTMTSENLTPVVMIDVPMPISYISENLVGELDKLEPFGKGNEKPLFAQQHVNIRRLMIIGRMKNVVKLSIEDENHCTMDALYFGDAPAFIDFLRAEYGNEMVSRAMKGMQVSMDIAVTYYPQINDYQGKRSLQIVIQNYCTVAIK